MSIFPLIYGFRELVAGAGFVAGVTVDGRALLKREPDGGWWVYGVEPGGVAAGGETEQEAYLNFREDLRQVLADSAALNAPFEAFRADVEKLGGQVNDVWDAEWQLARAALRAGELQLEGPFAELPRKSGDVPIGVTVLELQKITAEDNPGESRLLAAA